MAARCRPRSRSSPASLQKSPTMPHISEARQVLAELPLGDLLVVAEPLVALDLRVVVEVVLVAATAERGTDDVVALELVDRLEQVRGQRPEAARGKLVVRE